VIKRYVRAVEIEDSTALVRGGVARDGAPDDFETELESLFRPDLAARQVTG